MRGKPHITLLILRNGKYDAVRKSEINPQVIKNDVLRMAFQTEKQAKHNEKLKVTEYCQKREGGFQQLHLDELLQANRILSGSVQKDRWPVLCFLYQYVDFILQTQTKTTIFIPDFIFLPL